MTMTLLTVDLKQFAPFNMMMSYHHLIMAQSIRTYMTFGFQNDMKQCKLLQLK